MTKPKYKVGTLLIRKPGLTRDGWSPLDIFEEGVLLRITKVTKAMYFYRYLNLRPGQTGNAKFSEIETTCLIPTEVAELLYG